MEEERVYKVYMHTNLINDKKYIGLTKLKSEQRWLNGHGYLKNKYFYSAIKKYGWENFKHIVLFDRLTKKEAESIERELILFFNTNNRMYGYNHTNGGEVGKEYSQETLRKIKDNHADFSGENNPCFNKGRKIICLETLCIFDTISNAEKELKISTIKSALNGTLKSAGGLHFCYLEDYNPNTKYDLTLKYKPARRIYCNENNKIYDSIRHVSRELNLNRSNISKVLKGVCKQTKGYSFVYYGDKTNE